MHNPDFFSLVTSSLLYPSRRRGCGAAAVVVTLLLLFPSPPGPAAETDEAGLASASVDVGPRSSTATVFLHGWLMSTDLWARQMEALCAERRCYAVAQPGHGAPALDEPYTMTHWAERLREELTSAGIERAVLVGHSMGGMLAMEFVRRYPEAVLGLGLVGTTDTPGRPEVAAVVAQQLANWSPEMAAGWANLLIDPRFLSEHPAWMEGWQAGVSSYDLDRLPKLMEAIQGRDDLTGFTPSIAVPTVVIHSRTDRAVPFLQGEGLAERIPNAELFALDDCGHAAPMEQPEPVTEALEMLMARVEASRGGR
jgi:pimeloyl-ACP methyl ester carboxylesterase